MVERIIVEPARAAIAAARAGWAPSSVAAVGALALLLWFAPTASAGSPTHSPLPDLGLTGGPSDPGPAHPAQPFNHACGAAIDSQGNVYVASAANSTIDVFDAGHEYLTSIADSQEPCGLAVDSKGNLYVSEAKTGEVVKYAPSAYPFSGTPTYGAPVTIDGSGNAKGIAVDFADDRLYVAEGNRIVSYEPNGDQGIDEAQRVRVDIASGSFTLTFEGQTTSSLAFNASHVEVQAALEALSTIGSKNVSVSQGPEGSNPQDHRVTFTGALASSDVESLTGSSGCCVIQTIAQSWNGQIGESELVGATGVAAYTYGTSSPSHYVFAAEPSEEKIAILAGTDLRNLVPRESIDGAETPDGSLGLAATGSYLAVDPLTGHVYSFDAQHSVVDEFEASGHYVTQVAHAFVDAKPSAIAAQPQWNEIQRVNIDASGGSFRLGFAGDETEAFTYNPVGSTPSAAKVQKALEALPGIGAGNVSIFRSSGAYRVALVSALGKQDVSQVTVDGSGLTGDDPSVTETTGPLATVTTVKEGYGPGALYVTSGAGAGSEVFAFGPLPDPTRAPLPKPHSIEFDGACGAVVDDFGDLYVAGKAGIEVFAPEPAELDEKGNPVPIASIGNFDSPCSLAVDSKGYLYAAELGAAGFRVGRYTPSVYPPTADTTYTGPTIVEEGIQAKGIAVNPSLGDKDHVLVAHGLNGPAVEYASAKEGNGVLTPEFGKGLIDGASGIDVCGNSGNVYAVAGSKIVVVDATGTKKLATIDGSDSPRGPLSIAGGEGSLAVDQSNCRVLLGAMTARGAVEEFESAGSFVAEAGAGSFSTVNGIEDVAIDNSGGPNDGDLYAAQFKTLSAFGPLAYGEPPTALTGLVSDLGGGEATLNGTVDPHGFELSACRFDYTTEADFAENGFTGPQTKESPCSPGPAEIGAVSGAVAVHAEIGELDPGEHYCFRLAAESKYGAGEGDQTCFGPPVIATKSPQPILYREATLRGQVDPSGLQTDYRFQYGLTEAYGQSTPAEPLPATSGPTNIEAFLTGLAEGTEYHFRLVAENAAATTTGPDQTLRTLAKLPTGPCPNETLRLENNSTHLPDCRAYELVTPADTHGASPFAENSIDFNSWLVTPSGPRAGESLAYFLESTLPSTEGNGLRDALRATRGTGGWSSSLFSPSSVQSGNVGPLVGGVSSDQLYSFWSVEPGTQQATLPVGHYLRTPSGFEAIGQGEPAAAEVVTDLEADGRYLSAAGAHVIFSSKAHLAAGAAPQGTEALYDRPAGSPDAKLVSIKPDGSAFAAGQDARYEGATDDGAAVVFSVQGSLYLHRGNDTLEVAPAPASFAGVSDDGTRVFYTDSGDPIALANLWVFDVEGEGTNEIASGARFINVSADGSHAYFVKAGNLAVWDGSGVTSIAALDPGDLLGSVAPRFPGTAKSDAVALDSWTETCVKSRKSGSLIGIGRAFCPARTTPDGRFLLFQSHADLTPPYQGEGHSQVYRYDATDESLTCVSCDPSGAPAAAEADLQPFEYLVAPPSPTTVIPAITADGAAVFFNTAAALLPEDANSVSDVYEWIAQGSGRCDRPSGCLALISSGQSSSPSYIYSMTPDGHDVFFSTQEKLISSDIVASPSLYDTRVEGGFPQPTEAEPCHGDPCQGEATPPPARSTPRSDVVAAGNPPWSPLRCRRGRRRVRKAGKVRCLKPHRKHRHAKRRRRAGR